MRRGHPVGHEAEEENSEADPDQIVDEQEAAEAVARMLGGTICWTAAITGPSQASASICPIANSTQAMPSDGANKPKAKTGAAIRKQIAGTSA
jgi:hypothetical protein